MSWNSLLMTALKDAADGLSYAATCLKEAGWHEAAALCERKEAKARAVISLGDPPSPSSHASLERTGEHE